MSDVKLITPFKKIDEKDILEKVLETVDWIEHQSHIENDTKYWNVLPGKELAEGEFLLKDTNIYAGAAGMALLYLRLYLATKEERWLDNARLGINYVIDRYKGKEEFISESPFLPGVEIGYLNGATGGAFVASRLYQVTKETKYKEFAIRVTEDLIRAAKEEADTLTWYGFYGILGEGGLILYLIDAYELYGEKRYLEAAVKAARYIQVHKEDAPNGGSRWYVMPTETFPTIGKAGGYFPGFEYGAAGCGYILAKLYEHTQDEGFLQDAKEAATYILNIADYSEDGKAALVKYNDTYLTDLYYLGVCQGPIGTSRLFFELYQITKEEAYKEFVIKLTNGILQAGAPEVHSAGYWRTNCYCCGAAGMLEHFINVHKLTGENRYLEAAQRAAETLIGESIYKNKLRNWYTAWNRHEPETSDPYIGLYHGSGGCASALLAYRQYLIGEAYAPAYLEDPYKILFE